MQLQDFIAFLFQFRSSQGLGRGDLKIRALPAVLCNDLGAFLMVTWTLIPAMF
jgi:hypothetical protein